MLHDDKGFASFGVYHLAGTGETNWSGFARHILDTSRALGGPYARVRDIATEDYPTKAQRPAQFAAFHGKVCSHVRVDSAGLADVDASGGCQPCKRRTKSKESAVRKAPSLGRFRLRRPVAMVGLIPIEDGGQ